VESSFQHTARSSAGAVGVWQFTRSTGRKFLRVNAAVDERLDPVASARGAARYLREAHDVLGSWPLALTSYNHGVAGMARARAQFGDDFEAIVRAYDAPSFGFASKNFYAEYLAAREVATHPEVYFPEGVGLRGAAGGGRRPPPPGDDDPAGAGPLRGGPRTPAPAQPRLVARAAAGRIALPAGHRVWLPEGTLAGRRPAPDVAVAEARPDPPPARPSARVAKAAKPAHRYHKVRAGDTLWSVAKRYGLEVAELRKMNGLTAKSSRIRPGQRLRVGYASTG
jgi:membrane-bound lytic murein transglycosylase D